MGTILAAVVLRGVDAWAAVSSLKAHWAWVSLPAVVFALGRATASLVDKTALFHFESRVPALFGAGSGLLGGVGLALAVDSPLSGWFESRTHEIAALAAGSAAAILVAWAIRSVPDPQVYPRSWPTRIVLTAMFAPALALALQLGGHAVGNARVHDIVGNVLLTGWPILVGLALVALQIAWRHSLAADEPPFVVPRLREWDKAQVGIGATFVLADLALLIYVFLYQVPELLTPVDGLSAVQRAKALSDERRTILAVLAGLGAGVGLVYTHLRHELDRDANATGRYTEAVLELASDRVAVRLGGIHALERVARDSPGDRSTIVGVLAAYARESLATVSGSVAEDVLAAISVVGRIACNDVVDLRRCNFSDVDLSSVRFPSRSDLRGSRFVDVTCPDDWRSCDLRGATFARVRFAGAPQFQEAQLESAVFNDVDMEHADFSYASAESVEFSACRMKGASLRGADLQGATLRNVDLRRSSFESADMRRVTIERVQLRNADFDGALIPHLDLSGRGIRTDGLGPIRAEDDESWHAFYTHRAKVRRAWDGSSFEGC